jgi:hypothetical protein
MAEQDGAGRTAPTAGSGSTLVEQQRARIEQQLEQQRARLEQQFEQRRERLEQQRHKLSELFARRTTIGAGPAAKAVAEDAVALAKAEVALAKAELSQSMKEKAVGASLLTAAMVLGWFGIQGVLITLGFLLSLVVPDWAAALIVTLLLLACAGLAALLAKKRLTSPVSVDTTKRNVEEDVAWTKAHLSRQQARRP